MSNPHSRPTLHVPARDIPVPSSVSAQAQAMITSPTMVGMPYPPVDDPKAWHEYVAAMDGALMPMLKAVTSGIEADVDELQVDEARIFIITPRARAVDDRFVFLDIHGGGLLLGLGPGHDPAAVRCPK